MAFMYLLTSTTPHSHSQLVSSPVSESALCRDAGFVLEVGRRIYFLELNRKEGWEREGQGVLGGAWGRREWGVWGLCVVDTGMCWVRCGGWCENAGLVDTKMVYACWDGEY